MPKLACPCGFIHDLSLIPDKGWLTIRDRDLCAVKSLDEIDDHLGLLYECPECGRVMWRLPDGDRFRVYHPEQ
ncbi:MAG: hypothetical protein IT428_24165 [Planctomycetaceae bacterium]|nr:hypothetical protein [Planctomycetaceae bacterium]